MAGMMAKYFATSLAIENVVSAPRVISSCLPISTTSISLVGLESRSTMLPASRAACVPVFMATPTSACASAGASLVPSPHIATSLPLACSSRISFSLSSGVACARKSSAPASAAIAAAVIGLSPGIITVGMPMRGHSAKRFRMSALDDILELHDAEQAAVLGDRERGASGLRNFVRDRLDLARGIRHRALQHARGISGRDDPRLTAAIDIVEDRVDRALADRGGAGVDAAHAGLRGKGNEGGVEFRHVAAADAVFLLCQHDDRAAFRGLVGQRGEVRRIGELLLVDAADGAERGGLAVAERDGAGLVEQ